MAAQSKSAFPLTHIDAHQNRFYFNQVERLLDQTADLLERGLKDAAQADDLDSRRVEFAANMQEFATLNTIEQAEQAAEKYQHVADAALNEAQAQASLADGYKKRSALLLEASTYLANNIAEWCDRAGEVVWDSTNHDNGANNAQKIVTRHEIEAEEKNAAAALEAGNCEASAAAARSAAATTNASWERNNAIFQVQRWNAHVEAENTRLQASQQPDGGLNFDVRRKWLSARAERDFGDAVGRLKAAQEGLSKLYGYVDAIGWNHVIPVLSARLATRQQIEDCLNWVRNATAFLVAFGHREQACVRAISLRALMGPQKWDHGLSVGDFWFEIKEEKFFPKHRYVRLRGISAFVVPKRESIKGVWNCEISLPWQGYCRLEDDKASTLDQRFAPPVLLGRVSSRTAQMPADIGGVAAWYNLSPFQTPQDSAQRPNQWHLKFDLTSSADEPAADCVDDIVLDVSFALQFPLTPSMAIAVD